MKKILRALLVAALAVAAFCSYDWIKDNRLPNFKGHGELFVFPGDTPEDVIARLSDAPGIISERSLRRTFEQKQVATYLKPGHYTIEPKTTSVYVARMLNNGWQTPVSVTLSGSLRTRQELARKISRQMQLDSVSVMRAFDDEELMAAYGVSTENVFPLFHPATYEILWTASLEDLIGKCRKAKDSFWTDENRAKAAAVGLKPSEVEVLASIVKGESNYKPELRKIAGVYLNRINRGMLLQADPTVAYCYDYELKRILYRHLEFDSPYNTYKYPGERHISRA